jgi:hypothetical protein
VLLLVASVVLIEFGTVPLIVVMTFLERTYVVLGRGHHDFGSPCFLWVACGMPLGDGVKDDLSRERSPLSELRVTNHLPLNLLPLPLQLAFCLLQLSDQLIDFCNRRGCDLLNERNDLRINFCLSRNLYVNEIANFAFDGQVCG